eukprot:2130419-Pyramimonas_sp.AAC.1
MRGGVGAAVSKGLCFRRFLSSDPSSSDFGSGLNWQFLELKTKECVIAVGVMYLIVDLGFSGENIERIRAVSEFLGTLAIPWLLMGDFNVPVSDMDLS